MYCEIVVFYSADTLLLPDIQTKTEE
jgi:hypothetical protein